MSKKKKVVLGVVFVVFLVALWFITYFVCLQIKPKGDNVVTKEQLEELDKQEEVFYDAKITVNDEEYSLNKLTQDILGSEVVVDVSVDDKEPMQGYVTYSDVVDKAQVKVFKDQNYAQVILPDSVKGDLSVTSSGAIRKDESNE